MGGIQRGLSKKKAGKRKCARGTNLVTTYDKQAKRALRWGRSKGLRKAPLELHALAQIWKIKRRTYKLLWSRDKLKWSTPPELWT